VNVTVNQLEHRLKSISPGRYGALLAFEYFLVCVVLIKSIPQSWNEMSRAAVRSVSLAPRFSDFFPRRARAFAVFELGRRAAAVGHFYFAAV
jgi:hypothetical protein